MIIDLDHDLILIVIMAMVMINDRFTSMNDDVLVS